MSELPEGRKPLLWSDMTFGEARYDSKGRRVLAGHPSTWQQECEQLRGEMRDMQSAVSWHELRAITAIDEAKALRERVATLEAALGKIAEYLPLFDYVGSDEFGPRLDRPGSPFDRGREQEAKNLASIARAALQTKDDGA